MDWEGLYQKNDTGWDRGVVSPALSHWLDNGAILAKQRVLIPGCGRGYEVVALAKLGCDVTGIDLAPSAIKAVQASLQQHDLKADMVCDDIFSYQPPHLFDVIYEQTCLCALPLERREGYEQCLSAWLKPGGALCLSMMQTGEQGGPPFHCDYLEMKSLFSDERWLWQSNTPFIVPRPQQSARFELGFMLQRREEGENAVA